MIVGRLLVINQKTIIMKKTFLIVAVASLLSVANVKANEIKTQSNNFDTEIVDIKTLAVSPFCKAIMQGDIDTVRKLINLGENVNKKSLGMTPAIFAARYNKVEILKLLVEKGANLKMKSDKGITVMKQAKLSNAKEVITYLKSLS